MLKHVSKFHLLHGMENRNNMKRKRTEIWLQDKPQPFNLLCGPYSSAKQERFSGFPKPGH
jgi:hypothetical protein